MTSPHQDAAELVAELRDFIVDEPNYGKCLRMSIGAEHVERAANLIEQQAKALSEAEAGRAADNTRLKIQRDNALLDMEEFMNKAESAEARLAEAMKVIEPFASRDMSDIKDCVDNHDMRYQSQWFADATAAARSFLNSASNKEPR